MLNQKQWIVKQLKRSKSLSEEEKGEVWNQIQAVLVEAIRKKKEDINDWERQGLPFFDNCGLELYCEKEQDESVVQSDAGNYSVEETQRITVTTDSPGDLPMDEEEQEEDAHALKDKTNNVEQAHVNSTESQNDKELINLVHDEQVDGQPNKASTNESVSVPESPTESVEELEGNSSAMSIEIKAVHVAPEVSNGTSSEETPEKNFDHSVEVVETDNTDDVQSGFVEEQHGRLEDLGNSQEDHNDPPNQTVQTQNSQLKDPNDHNLLQTDDKDQNDEIVTYGQHDGLATNKDGDKQLHAHQQSENQDKPSLNVINYHADGRNQEIDKDSTPRLEVITFRAFPRKGYLDRVKGNSNAAAISSHVHSGTLASSDGQFILNQSANTQPPETSNVQNPANVTNDELIDISKSPPKTPQYPFNNSTVNSPTGSPIKTASTPTGSRTSQRSPNKRAAESSTHFSKKSAIASTKFSPVRSSASSPKNIPSRSPDKSPSSFNIQESAQPEDETNSHVNPGVVTSQSPILTHTQSADDDSSTIPNIVSIDHKSNVTSETSPKGLPRSTSVSIPYSNPSSNQVVPLVGRENASESQKPSNTVTTETDKTDRINLNQQVELLRRHFVNISNRSDDLTMQQEIESIFEKTTAIENLEKKTVFQTVCSQVLVKLFLKRSDFSTQILPYLQIVCENSSIFNRYQEQDSYEYHLCLLTCYYIYHHMESELDNFAQCIVDRVEALNSEIDKQTNHETLPKLLCKIALSILYAYLDRNYHDLFKCCFQLVTIVDTEDQATGKDIRLQSIRFALATFLNREREKAISVIQQNFKEIPLRVLIYELRFYTEDECIGFLQALNLLTRLKEPQRETDDIILRLN